MNAEDISASVWIVLSIAALHVIEANDNQKRWLFNLQTHEFSDCIEDPTLICVRKPVLNFRVNSN